MTPERWATVKSVFDAALETSPERRRHYVEEVCTGDIMLEQTILRLLARHEESNGFLDTALITDFEQDALYGVSGGTFRPGEVVNHRFCIERMVGHGGMGEVYEAVDLELNETVALKTIRLESSEIPHFAERFKEEVCRARRIVSRNVCRVHDLFIHHDGKRRVPFLTMEFLDGIPLSRFLQDHEKLERDKALEILGQIAAGLGAVHAAGVLHLDLKPANIMLCPDAEPGKWRVVIMDFGLARQDGGIGGELPVYGGSIGTLSYMAPEQFVRDRVTIATDIFAMGLTAFETVTGKKPFSETAGWAGAATRLDTPLPKASLLNPTLDVYWDTAFAQCLAKNPEDRFSTAEAFVAALVGPAAAPGRRLLLGFAASGLVAASVAGYVLSRKQGPPVPIAVVLVDGNELDPRPMAYLAAGFADRLRVKLLRNRRLFVVSATKPEFRNGQELAQLARELKTSYAVLVKGTNARSRLDLIVRVVKTSSGQRLGEWTGSATAGEIDALSTIAAKQVMAQIGLPASDTALTSVAMSVLNPAAYDQFLLGVFHLNRRTDDGLLRAKEYLQAAIAADPEFGRAYSALAVTDAVVAERNLAAPKESLLEAKQTAIRARELDPGDAVAYAAMAQVISLLDRDLRRSEFEFKRSIELDPFSVQSHQWYSYLLQKERRFEEALIHANEAIRLEPLSVPANGNLAVLFQYARDDDRMLQQFRKLLQLDPQNGIAHSIMALALGRRGLRKEAIELFGQGNRPRIHPHRMRSWVELNVILGNRLEAEQTTHRLVELKAANPSVPASYVAISFAALGRADEAYLWIERAFDEYDGFLSMIHAHPAYDPIRGDRRYGSILARLGIHPASQGL